MWFDEKWLSPRCQSGPTEGPSVCVQFDRVGLSSAGLQFALGMMRLLRWNAGPFVELCVFSAGLRKLRGSLGAGANTSCMRRGVCNKFTLSDLFRNAVDHNLFDAHGETRD